MKKNLLTIIILLVFTVINLGGDVFVKEEVAKQSEKKKDLNEIYSDKKLGSFYKDGKTYFRLFTPNAKNVVLFTFKKVDGSDCEMIEMKSDEDGVWEASLDGDKDGLFYGFKVSHSKNDKLEELPLCVDPYAKAVASKTTYMNPRKSIVYNREYDWEGDKWVQRDWKDLIIYEMHIRDMTAHETSGASSSGTYQGLIENDIVGGINYIKELGVNTVELLPAQEFGVVEIPYKDTMAGRYNTWNPYERNHWGYMTSNYFAPEAYFTKDWKEFKFDEWIGADASQVKQFKEMVKAFHKEGIGVMMDVVYNHLSEYEIGNLKQIDKEYYFRLDEEGNFIAESFCGNDLKTERPMLRRLIVESVIYWMKEYHIDGFRFDLGHLIDWETLEEIIKEARKINPNVVFTAEPWGGGYDPNGFSMRDWASWNDQIRNGIKGENPHDGYGWIFGHMYGNNNLDRIKSYVNGTLTRDSLGLFNKKEHSVNYLESHDGYTLGDFIRIGTGEVKHDEVIKNIDKNAKLSSKQLKLNKLAAAFLFTSQGMTMIHSGQEFGRSKVIPKDVEVDDQHKGMIDHNTYNKDNEVNYINYDHAEMNNDLMDYYKGLIQLREKYDAFRRADYDNINFINNNDQFSLAYTLKHIKDRFFVAFNANQDKSVEFELPEGNWEILVNQKSAGIEPIETKSNKVKLKAVSAVVLKKK